MDGFNNLNSFDTAAQIENEYAPVILPPANKMKKSRKIFIAVKAVLLALSLLLSVPVGFAGLMFTSSYQGGIALPVWMVLVSALSLAATVINSKETVLSYKLNGKFSLKAAEITLLVINAVFVILPVVAAIVLSIAFDNFG